MDVLNSIIAVPSWAYDFCYYYMAVAAIMLVFTVYSIVQLIFLPAAIQKILPTASIVLNLGIYAAITIVLSMMQFWICRSALKPAALKEAFAVACANDADCTAVNGTQGPRSLCSCGGRGTCGGCTMNNNMQPQATDFDLAPAGSLNESFRNMGKAVPTKRR
jgi:hypothetical protein